MASLRYKRDCSSGPSVSPGREKGWKGERKGREEEKGYEERRENGRKEQRKERRGGGKEGKFSEQRKKEKTREILNHKLHKRLSLS